MKKTIITIFGIIAICLIVFISYVEYQYATYVNSTIKVYTGIIDYSILQKVHNDQEWYAKISIQKSDIQKLLKLHNFKCCYTMKVIAGKVQQEYIKDCPTCLYYLDDKGHGIYGYVLYCLNENKNQLEIYEQFGN